MFFVICGGNILISGDLRIVVISCFKIVFRFKCGEFLNGRWFIRFIFLYRELRCYKLILFFL